MDNTELKNTLIAQKKPLDMSVKEKIAYLESDEPFSLEADKYMQELSFFSNNKSDDDLLKEAFGMNSSEQSVPMTTNFNQKTSETRRVQHVNDGSANRSMTISERIAALRGALNVPMMYSNKK